MYGQKSNYVTDGHGNCVSDEGSSWGSHLGNFHWRGGPAVGTGYNGGTCGGHKFVCMCGGEDTILWGNK